MNRPIAFTLGVLVLGGLVRPASAQYGYPYYPQANYYPPMAYPQPMVQPVAYGAYGRPMMPMAQPMPQPMMMVPMMVQQQPVPMWGPVESLTENAPLNGQAPHGATVPATAQPGAAPVVHTSATTPAAAAPASAAAAKAAEAKPWYKKTWDFILFRDTK